MKGINKVSINTWKYIRMYKNERMKENVNSRFSSLISFLKYMKIQKHRELSNRNEL